MSDGLENISSLKEKIGNLKQLFEMVRDERDVLKIQKQQYERDLSDARSKLEELEVRYNNLKLAQAFALNEDDKDGAKRKIDRIVREIDKCIALLNQ